MKTKPKTVSPIIGKPHNVPGESLYRQLNDTVFEKMMFYYVLALIAVILCGFEWWRFYTDTKPNPILSSIVAVIFVLIALYKIPKYYRQAKLIKQGIDGEKAVGQFLERLRSDSAVVYHDIEGDGFNVDHVVIHRSGIYVIETKTMAKPTNKRSTLSFDGTQVLKDGVPLKLDAIPQVKACANWMRELFRESAGKEPPIRHVVLYPGWFIKSTQSGNASGIWVLNPKSFPQYLANETAKISEADVHLFAFHLSRYIRTS